MHHKEEVCIIKERCASYRRGVHHKGGVHHIGEVCISTVTLTRLIFLS